MKQTIRSFVGMDVHKATISSALQKTAGVGRYGSSV